MRSATDLYRAGRYHDALRGFESTRAAAQRTGQEELAARALGNIGGCQFALHEYRTALQSFRETIRLAKAAGDHSAVAAFEANIASLYSEMGELETATQWMEGTLERLNPDDRRALRPKILVQLATFRARQGRMQEARHLFSEGISAADAAGDLETAAIGWNRLGEEYLKQNDLRQAEGPLLEAYRIRNLHKLALDSSYRSLGRLRLEQGELETASVLLDRAVELSTRPQGAIPTWDVYHHRGRLRLAQGRLQDALADLRIARRLARVWRWSVPPGDAMRIGAENWLDAVHSALVETGNRLYRQTHDPSLIRETFEAVEENRASSLRAILHERDTELRGSFPPEYWEALARLQRAEVQALRVGGGDAVQAARAELARMEVSMGPAVAPPPPDLMDAVRRLLDRDTVLLSFRLGSQAPWVWGLDREDLVLYELPPRAVLERLVGEASEAIRQGRTDSGLLWKALFGQLPARLQQKKRWLVALDGGLFQAPLAALRESGAPDGASVVEHHIVEVIPGAGYWVETRSRSLGALQPGLLVGLGDPIYNYADPRLPGSSNSRGHDTLALPRLVASGAELDESARAWRGESVLLKGPDASRAHLRAQLARDPEVVHLATHVVESGDQPSYGLIALSMIPKREPQLLTPAEVAAWRTHANLVVLSGCDSAEGAALPGTGLLGLTRAWLIAGAGTVVASNWSTPDTSGALFGAFYRHLSAHPESGPAASLQAAQVEMIHAGGWRANPRYWGAYFAMGAR
jgi:CHAT domain-containing protein/tetratricopeptide (TPR) repeat protein